MNRTPSAGFRVPPDPISRILGAPPTPALSLSPDRRLLAFFGRPGLPPLEELAEPEVGLAGIRLNPENRSRTRETHYRSLEILELGSGDRREISLPPEIRISYPRWSPDSGHLCFIGTEPGELKLWFVDVRGTTAAPVAGAALNATLGLPFSWLPDSSGVVARLRPPAAGPAPAPPQVPPGPGIRENRGGTRAARTYQDLLATDHDEVLFEHLCTSRLALVRPGDGAPRLLKGEELFYESTPSPDGRYLLVEYFRRPFSRLVPWYRFPARIEVRELYGGAVHLVSDLPLAEEVPVAFDAVPTGPRSVQWRSDADAELVWVEALDGGDPAVPADLRDVVRAHAAPFEGAPRELIRLEHRLAGIFWGDDSRALIYSRWWKSRWLRTELIRPGDAKAAPRVLWDRSYSDRYSDPGAPATVRDDRGQSVLATRPDGTLLLVGDGASPAGDYPFLDSFDPESGATERLWQARDPYYEATAAILDPEAPVVLTRRESVTEPPNFHLRDLSTGAERRITHFPDPAPELAGIGRELITYQREDGVRLSGTLYTPPGYDPSRDGPLPTFLWAYPREYLDPEVAGQTDDSPNRFSRPGGASPLFLLLRGFALLDGPAMPIVAEETGEPNDSYVEQLVMGARAAVEELVRRGVSEPGRIAVGGHSYGAAMVANLLAHTDLFCAGIGRSGAYNRTLTPFGFQSEQRSYWDATEAYHRLSPFTHAPLVSVPLLLIHGERDDNSGTFPLQTERFYHALVGHGATVRYVSLPLESHSYRARESVLHTLAEMIDWLEEHCG
jgi:dipeptidyl aminopeptidase/acylaminoacyl peptidase